jgi:selenocysteine-specific elongation factor
MDIIVGTAGHIDHGKTALLRALTGTDTDRLPEEKQRGITIDIGFAELELDDMHLGFVDVPGHERFVKNMLAGASGIDFVLLVIAADEGVMPQTREHFEICRLLGVKAGIVVLTKSDLVDNETMDLARLDAAELVVGSFLENAPVAPVSSKSGEGVDELKKELLEIAKAVPTREADIHAARLPIDRCFTMKGFGAVVTGTLASGEIKEGEELELLPDGRRVRVRGIQVHGRTVNSAHAGQRTAINLGGIDHSQIGRGMLLAEPGSLSPTQVLDAEVEMMRDAQRPLRSRQRVRLHIGTAEILARVSVLNETGEIAAGARGMVQLRLEKPVATLIGERFILRCYSPQITIGGGRVVVPLATRHRRRELGPTVEFLSSIADANQAELVMRFVEAADVQGVKEPELRFQTGWNSRVLRDAIEMDIASWSIVDAGGTLTAASGLEGLEVSTLRTIGEFHAREPLAAGMPRDALKERLFRYVPPEIFTTVLRRLVEDGKIVADKELVRSASHRTELSKDETGATEQLKAIFHKARFEPPRLEEALAAASIGIGLPTDGMRKLLDLLVRSGEVVKVTDDFYFAGPAIDYLKSAVRRFADQSPDRVIDVPKFKEIAGISRKYAIPLLEFFDREKVTVRAGDKRVVLK